MKKQKVEQMEILGGNTKSPKKRINQSKRWCFTLNNYTDAEVEQMDQVFTDMNIKYIYGYEVGEKCGTPHLQGYIEREKKFRWSELKLTKRIQWIKCNGNRESNLTYCSKEGEYKTNMRVPKPLVKVTLADVERICPDGINIIDLFKEDEVAGGRKIYWFWEAKGCWGKTLLSKYFVDQMDAICVAGKAADAKFIIADCIKNTGECPPIVILDIPRTNGNGVSYQAIEAIKNGILVNTKYESGMVRFNSPHVLIFANEPPDEFKLSGDRWIIECLDEGERKKACVDHFENPDPWRWANGIGR